LLAKSTERLETQDVDIDSKIKASIKMNRDDIATAYIGQLQQAQVDLQKTGHQLEHAQLASKQAMKARDNYVLQMQRRTSEAMQLINQSKQAKLQEQLAQTMASFQIGDDASTFDEMRDKILRGTAHITVTRADGQPMPDYRGVAERIRKVAGVTGAAPTTYDGAVVSGPSASAYAVLRGIDSGSVTARLELRRTLIGGSLESLFEAPVSENGEPRLPNVILGSELAKRTGLQVDDVAEIIPASASLARRAPRVPALDMPRDECGRTVS